MLKNQLIDQISISGRESYTDFGASVAARNHKMPVKKVIKETIPYSNVTYDFSAINGEVYWEERELEYIFEMIASTPEKLEEMKERFCDWVMNVFQEKLIDPLNPFFHYLATFSDIAFADDEGLEKTTATVKFTAYPYKIANEPRVFKYEIKGAGQTHIYINNDSSHRITPTIESAYGIEILRGSERYIIPAGTVKDANFQLNKGTNDMYIVNKLVVAEPLFVTISFTSEVF